jgi:stage V sporulation protein G
MVITSVRVTPVDTQRMLAVASVTLCDCFVLRAMRLIKGQRRSYVSMPTRQSKTGGSFEVYHPIDRETRSVLERVIIEGYQKRATSKTWDLKVPVYLGSESADFVITKVRVRPYEELKLRGFASIVLDDCMTVTGMKIIIGKRRSFVQMPNVRKRSGRFRDLAFPTLPEIRELIEKAVFEEYERVQGEEVIPLPQ